ncbi:hypothetical protein [Streptomyces mirabilis]|uniref:hypothetical protein n=1 Tax=Streptomyces mirabilis TaxID=68239 RepID=UPI0033B3DDE1
MRFAIDLLREVLPWSAGLLLIMCLIALGQSSRVLDWILPRRPELPPCVTPG